jgi:hypothetical protein
MKFFAIVLPAILLPFSLIAFSGRGTHSVQNQALSAPAGADATEKMNDSWAKDQKLLVAYEREQSKLRAEVIHRRRLYLEGQLAKAEVLDAERALVSALSRIHEVRRSMTETDIAITEATFKDELLRMPTPAVNGFSETEHLSRFNGGARWSLKQGPGIEKFYSQTFGRNLPVTAYGQTATHDQMRFNHRDSMDVALHPDSPEGKALISHLRRSGIPFIAFKGRVAGASTGAHIHIGHPSHRTASN